MRRVRLLLSALLAALSLQGSSANAADPAQHVVLYYLNSGPMTLDNTRPLIAYVDPAGKPLDWMFDGLLLFTINFAKHTAEGVEHPTDQDALDYEHSLFDQGQLALLAENVRALRTTLQDPTYRLKLYLAAPYVSGLEANANVQKLLDRYAALQVPELELEGFYWGYNEDAWDPLDAVRIPGTAGYVHDKGYLFLWIPYFDANIGLWKQYGFDRATLQPNYAFRDVGLERFAEAEDRRRSWGLSGMELEFGPPRNNTLPQQDPEQTSALAYLEAADQYNWSQNELTTYYWASAISGYASKPARRPLYDGLYRYISARQRHSVAESQTRIATQDTFVEKATGYSDKNHGTGNYLNLGTNAYPNAKRTYVSFSLGSEVATSKLLAAHLQFGLQEFAYGDMLNDVVLYQLENPAWQETTLTGNSEPASNTWSPLSRHRLTKTAAQPYRYSWDVTDRVSEALQTKAPAISFVLRREAEDGTEAEAVFQARELKGTMPPTLHLVVSTAEDGGVEAALPDTGPESAPEADAASELPAIDTGPEAGKETGPEAASESSQNTTTTDGSSCGCRTRAGRNIPGSAFLILSLVVVRGAGRRKVGRRADGLPIPA